MDYCELAQDLVRHLRGRRSQTALSRRLGYSTNVIYTWESGKRQPTAVQFFDLAARCRRPPAATLARFYRQTPRWLHEGEPVDRDVITQLLQRERGRIPLVQVARDAGLSRFSLARYFRGEADIRFSDFLRLLDTCSRRLLDFVALWANPAQMPRAAQAWSRQQLARRAAYEKPWSHAVLHCLELEQYRQAAKYDPAVVARLLGITEVEVEACIELLEASQQVMWNGTHWQVRQEMTVELGADSAGAKALASWWLKVAAERAASARRGMFAYNLCSVSRADLQRIAEVQKDCLRQIRSIIAGSHPGERVALVAVQVMGLEHDS